MIGEGVAYESDKHKRAAVVVSFSSDLRQVATRPDKEIPDDEYGKHISQVHDLTTNYMAFYPVPLAVQSGMPLNTLPLDGCGGESVMIDNGSVTKQGDNPR